MIIPLLNVLAVLVQLMANLLALDQASKVSGYAVFNPEGDLIAYGKFIADVEDLGERLVFIKNKVAELIEKYNID